MNNLHTGLPGDGKTLHTLCLVEKRRLAENRAVYYWGISELKLDWILLSDEEVKRWYELPAGAIIVLDEAQKLFPPRPNGAPIPKMEAELETHRHHGFDIYLITQMPTMLPAHCRGLMNVHRHFMRKLGSKWYTCHQFSGCRDNVGKSRKDSIESQHLDDTSMYANYKSASIITQKARVPWKVWAMVALPFAMLYIAYGFYQRRIAPQPVDVPSVSSGAVRSGQPSGVAHAGPVGGAPQAVKRTYDLASFQPRLEGLPHTAPRYDELTAPVRVPTVAGCVWFEKSQRGHCYTQQGTLLTPPADFIKQYVARGMFEDHDRGPPLGQNAVDSHRRDSAVALARPPTDKQSSEGVPAGGR